MSMTTRYLLQRSGRDQFGIGGNTGAATIPSPAPTDHDDAMWKLHRDLHDDLVRRHGPAWLTQFAGLTKKAAWIALTGGEGSSPGLSTFRKMAGEYASFEEFLLYWLVSNKRNGLERLGLTQADIDAEMKKYVECGRYFVTYGAGRRTFGTNTGRPGW